MRFSLPTVALATASILCLSISTLASPARAMDFRVVQTGDGGTVIAATGQITESTPGEFASFVQSTYGSSGARPVVLLNSPGGRVLASMQLGTLMRRMGAATVVNGECYSACVYAFMGGRKRVVPSSGQLGIHRMFAYEQEYDANSGESYVRRRYDNGAMGSMLKRYTSAMGVNPAVISQAEHTSSDGLKILSRRDIQRYRLGSSR